MDKIASFTVNHLDLIPGVYVSRKDYVGKRKSFDSAIPIL